MLPYKKARIWHEWHQRYSQPFNNSGPVGPMGGGLMHIDATKFIGVITHAVEDGLIIQAPYFLRWVYPTIFLPWNAISDITSVGMKINKKINYQNERKGVLKLRDQESSIIVVPWNSAFKVPSGSGVLVQDESNVT